MVDDYGGFEHLLQRHDAAFQEGLRVLGLVVAGVLRNVAALFVPYSARGTFNAPGGPQ